MQTVGNMLAIQQSKTATQNRQIGRVAANAKNVRLTPGSEMRSDAARNCMGLKPTERSGSKMRMEAVRWRKRYRGGGGMDVSRKYQRVPRSRSA